ncbi:MAG: CBS domain-containing protein [archaeon]
MLLESIQKRRKILGLTQAQLAEKAEVSQSMIAKIEAGKLSPSYENATAIFDALDSLEKEKSLKASKIMHKEVITVKSSDYIEDVIKILKQKGISQLPVFQGNHLVGLVSEKEIVENLSIPDLGSNRVSLIMKEAPPTISEDTPVKIVSELLRYAEIVLVYRKAELAGVITKADLLKTI